MIRSQVAARVLPALSMLCLCALHSLASAQSSPYFIGVSQTASYDSNFLRLTDNEPVPIGYSRNDTTSTTSLLAGFDQSFGRQRAYANIAVRNNRYSDNKIFNNTAYNLSGGLDFSTVERVSGTVSFSGNRSLQRFNSYEVGVLTQKNLETVKAVDAQVNVGLVTEYSFEVTGGRRTARNSLQIAGVQSRNFDQDNLSAGLRWRPSPATSVGLSYGVSKGNYPNFATSGTGEYLADRFERKDLSISADWRPSGSSTFDLRIASGDTSYDLNQQRDFSGVTGNLSWRWQATGKITLTTALSRDTGQDSVAYIINNSQTSTLDYSRLTNALRVTADYAATAKIAVSANAIRYNRTLGTSLAGGVATSTTDERTTIVSLGARWTPQRWMQFGCDISQETRSARGPVSTELRARMLSCYGQATLQ